MKITADIWNEGDKEKRHFLWSFYLQQVDQSIRSLKLSPQYREVVSNKDEMKQLVNFIDTVQNNDKQLVGLDLSALKLLYESNQTQEGLQSRLEEIKNVFIPQLDKRYHEYAQLKDFLYQNITIEPVGIENLYSKEGYLMLHNKDEMNIYAYSYFISNYVNNKKRSIVKLKPVKVIRYGLETNLINQKKLLNKAHQYHLNCYFLETKMDIPFHSTFLPIAKGKISRYLKSA